MALEHVGSQRLHSETKADDPIKVDVTDDVDFVAYSKRASGRLVVDPEQAKVEFGEVMASRLKLSRDGLKWTDFRKTVHLIIITMSAVVPDFDSGIGIASIFGLAQSYNTTSGVINDLTSNWSIFLLDLLISKGLYVVTDISPFHLQARKLNIWTSGFVISPYLSPFVFGFLVARVSWRWAYAIGSIYSVIVLLLIVFFMEETMYDRHLASKPLQISTGLRYRFETLRGALVFGFSIGLNTTNVVFMGSPPPVGFGFSQYAVAVLIGEFIGRYVNEFIMDLHIRKNNGFFEAESRLWTCYLAMPLYICGFLTLGAGIQNLSEAALIMGWGIAIVAITLNTVAVYAYCNDCFPRRAGGVSALLNLARALDGFAVAYFQVPWATKSGGLMVFGIEAAQACYAL
ncbi:hypothetical protein BDR06DRAFT_979677 [Suillus hirtellus]|nr:hypothetical protein BDR06DRAFT_979677 [Suillus hirtellus]